MDKLGHIVVCLVAYRNIDDVVRCLDALAGQTYTDFEIVICENGGKRSYDQLRACLPDRLLNGQKITVIADETNPGYAGGVNRCIALRKGQSGYWILNPDTHPDPLALSAMVEALANKDVEAVGGPIVLPTGVLQTCGGNGTPCLPTRPPSARVCR